MIKNECGHAYKLLDHAECLWCENCVEKLAKRLSKKLGVTEEWILEWERRLTHYAMGLTYKEANREIRTMLNEIGVSVA